MIASIPNVRHRVVIGELLHGNFDYRQGGIMDNTHLRFFTFTSIVRMFSESGYKIQGMMPMVASDKEAILSLWKTNNLPQRMQEIIKLLTNVDYSPTYEDLVDFLTVQFIVIAGLPAPTP